jgi:hypothetical protein
VSELYFRSTFIPPFKYLPVVSLKRRLKHYVHLRQEAFPHRSAFELCVFRHVVEPAEGAGGAFAWWYLVLHCDETLVANVLISLFIRSIYFSSDFLGAGVAINHQYRKTKPATNESAVAEMKEFAADETMEIKLLLGRVEQNADSIAETMKKIHGGKWTVSINHDGCFVMVSKDFS